MRIAVPRETVPGETRVALVPETVGPAGQGGLRQSRSKPAPASAAMFVGRGLPTGRRHAGRRRARALSPRADVVLKVREPTPIPASARTRPDLLREGATLIAFLRPRSSESRPAQARGARHHRVLDGDDPAHLARAEDGRAVLDEHACAGYKAVLLAAGALGQVLPAAHDRGRHRSRPARVFVLGAGVAGLQAIATARRLGAVVEAFDVRPAVQARRCRASGATFVEHELIGDAARRRGRLREGAATEQQSEQIRQTDRRRGCTTPDVVITTALDPGHAARRSLMPADDRARDEARAR